MGGFAGTSQSDTNTAEIYDPATGQWSATGNMNASRYRTTARLLPDGRVFVMNTDGYGGGSSYGEVFDPQTGVFTKTGNLVEATGWHGVVVLADGRVLKVGGSANGYSRRAEIWDPVTNQWTETGSMAATRYQSVPVLLPDGKVLVAGGSNGSFLNTSEIYDPAADVFNYTAAAGSGVVQVTAPATCPWSVSGLPSWITATSASSGTGNGRFSFNVAANVVSGSLGGARSASGQLSGPGYAKTMVFNQEANPCLTWSVNPNSISLPIGGSAGSFSINANSSCNWSLSSIPAWMSVSSSLTGSGTAIINYTVAANTGTPRSTTAYVIGAGPLLSISLNQAGTTPPAPVCGTPISSGVAINGYLQSSTCPTGARGSGYYTDRYTFTSAPGRAVTILLTSPAFDTYLYLRDPSGIVIKSDDDGGGGYNSRIPASTGSFTLPAGSSGVYTIEVTSYGAGRTGAYTLNLTQ